MSTTVDRPPATPDQAVRKLLWAFHHQDPTGVRDAIIDLWGIDHQRWINFPEHTLEMLDQVDLSTRLPSPRALHAACRDILAAVPAEPVQTHLKV